MRGVRALLAAIAVTMLVAAWATPAGAPMSPLPDRAGRWRLLGWRPVPASGADQGVATLSLPGSRERLVFRGDGDVSGSLRARGWWHVGDPGSAGGYLLAPYQGQPSRRAKLFVLTAPDGRRSNWLHRLAPGEMVNNSFVAIAPSRHWFVAGEWGRMTRLLVFPMPAHNAAARPGRDLPLAATIRLSRQVRNLQGCGFASATALVCTANSPDAPVFGVSHGLIAITLAHPVNGRQMSGRPVLLGALPQVSRCGQAETEGVDVHGDRLVVVAHERGACRGRVDVFTYRAAG